MKKAGSSFKWAGISMFFHHPFVFDFIPHNLAGKVVIDCGCGKGIYGFLIRATRDLEGAKLIGMDISEEYLSFARSHNIYDKYIIGDNRKLPLGNKSVDLVLGIEVISHLSKSNGSAFLAEIDRICRGRSVIVCPNGIKHKQPEYVKSDSHVSVWSSGDFTSRGYAVYGFGLRLPSPEKSFLVKPYFALQYISSPFTRFIPSLAGFLVAVKDY